ncbi:MAG: hypothetical protein K2Y51_17395 [Gammaproteobacteria bacterium]|nr:hypothetical protein [Gammaproteobacteria bacterium]
MVESIHRLGATLVFAAAMLGVFGLYPGAAIAIEPSEDIGERIEAAATKADHEAIAVFYDEEAKRIDADVARHKRMSAAYKGARSLRQLGLRMKKHCDELIKGYEDLAVETRRMARAHREMATALP